MTSTRTNFSATNQNAAEARVVSPILLADFEFENGTLYLTNANKDVPAFSRVYTGVGEFGGISELEESPELRAYDMEVYLSGVPASLVATVLGTKYQNRDARIYVGFLNDDEKLVDDPYLVIGARMDVMDIIYDDSGDAQITLHLENRLADWERARVKRWNDATQQADFDGDTGASRVASLIEKEIVWPDEKFFA